MTSSTLYRYLSQTAPASSFLGERYLLLTECLLLWWQFSTSPQGSAARSKRALLLLLQLLLNCAHRSIHAWKNFRKRALLAEPCPEGGLSASCQRKAPLTPSSYTVGQLMRPAGQGEMEGGKKTSEKPSPPRFLPELLFVQRSFWVRCLGHAQPC